MRQEEYIICAAIKRLNRRDCHNPYYEGMNDILDIEIGYRHVDIFRRFQGEVSTSPKDQGFYTSYGRFVNREDAMQIAFLARQVNEDTAFRQDGTYKDLFSEDLY